MPRDDYQDRQDARRARYERRAERAEQESFDLWERGHEGLPPTGEPIKIGHHSERRHRAALARSHRLMDRSCEERDKAEHCAHKADAVGRGGISGDDPEAIAKLEAKLAKTRKAWVMAKDANAVYRKGGMDALAAKYPRIAENFAASKRLCPWVKAPCDLSGYGPECKRIEQRIRQLEHQANREATTEALLIQGTGWTFREDRELNRYRFDFWNKQPADKVATLKRQGYRWSPRERAWLRQITPSALYWGMEFCKTLPGCPALD